MNKGKKLLLAVVLIGLCTSGCASLVPLGTLYTDVSLPTAIGSGEGSYSKVGTATANSYFCLIAVGDSSIEAAAKDGGITDIKFVDYKATNILGIFGEYTTFVYGD